MDADVYNVCKAFADSFHESVGSMTGLTVKRVKPGQEVKKEGEDFVIMTGFKGQVTGTFIIRSSAAASLRLYEKYLGETPGSFDESVLDGMKEFAGIINGSASGKEQALKLQFTPSMTLMGNMKAHVSSKTLGLSVSYFVEECGVFTVEIHHGKSA
ncbi:MAG: chemotaxis protein CheX [Lentisphaeraceae bacterium]|nr:chemotaxis protein CheX [Lentisphaeraceae bacterium]